MGEDKEPETGPGAKGAGDTTVGLGILHGKCR